jgi:hypothetical protein
MVSLEARARELQVEKEAKSQPFMMGRHLIDLGLSPSAQFKKFSMRL